MKKVRKFFSTILVVLILGLWVGMGFTAEPVFSWASNGVAICETAGDQNYPFPTVISDGAGGAIIVWQDYRSGDNWDIYAQRINSSGTVQWAANGVVICNAAHNQQINPTAPDNFPFLKLIISDGAGGAIIVWKDYRSNNNWDIYAQRIDADGAVQWAANGVAICTEGSEQKIPQLVSDGEGGAIISWQDERNGNWDIYAQRIDADGAVQWAANGVAICADANDQTDSAICADGASGAIIVWHDERDAHPHIYAQRIDADGAVQWAANGIAISAWENVDPLYYGDWFPAIISDSAGGAIIGWSDTRRCVTSGYQRDLDIYVQRVDANGTILWAVNGIAITDKDGRQEDAMLVPDGSGGAIITWCDDPTEEFPTQSSNFDVRAQRIDADGTALWAAAGVPLSTAVNEQSFARPCSDGSGGAIISWHDCRSGQFNLYGQAIDSSGNIEWTGNGAKLCQIASQQAFPRIASDGSGGAIIAWFDNRGDGLDVYAQKVTVKAETTAAKNEDPCFIATATYGSPIAKEVKRLKEFRDNVLLKTTLGRDFVKLYYRTSPPIANFIRNEPILKAMVRIGLEPLIWLSRKFVEGEK